MKKLLIFLPFLVLIFGIISMRPVPSPNENNVETVMGVVGEIYKAGADDIVFRLVGDDHFYYVNTSVKEPVDYTQLKKKLLYKDVEISYIKHWSLLNASGSARFMCQLKTDRQIVFSSLETE